jgi:hypothetical protein
MDAQSILEGQRGGQVASCTFMERAGLTLIHTKKLRYISDSSTSSRKEKKPPSEPGAFTPSLFIRADAPNTAGVILTVIAVIMILL